MIIHVIEAYFHFVHFLCNTLSLSLSLSKTDYNLSFSIFFLFFYYYPTVFYTCCYLMLFYYLYTFVS